jgi:hypothetical protein
MTKRPIISRRLLLAGLWLAGSYPAWGLDRRGEDQGIGGRTSDQTPARTSELRTAIAGRGSHPPNGSLVDCQCQCLADSRFELYGLVHCQRSYLLLVVLLHRNLGRSQGPNCSSSVREWSASDAAVVSAGRHAGIIAELLALVQQRRDRIQAETADHDQDRRVVAGE